MSGRDEQVLRHLPPLVITEGQVGKGMDILEQAIEEGGRLTVPQDSQADADTQQETLGTNAS